MAEYVPIPDLPTLDDVEPADLINRTIPDVVWGFHLPPSVDAERIVVNKSALHRYQKIGALSSSVVLEYQGDTTKFTPGISGINQNGVAVASRAAVRSKAEKSEGHILDPPEIALTGLFGRPIAMHGLNKPELARISTDKITDKAMSREKAWSETLDTALRQSFRRVGKKHLCERAPRWARGLDYGLYGFWAGLAASSIASGHTTFIPEIWAAIQAISTGSGALTNKHFDGHTYLNERRWSIFYSNQQSDRYLALCAMSGLSQLIGVRK